MTCYMNTWRTQGEGKGGRMFDHAVLINQYHFIEKDEKISSTKCPKGKKDLFSMQNL